jgi:hypothetical protein
MKYFTLGGLLLTAILIIQCSPGLTITAEPTETPGISPSPSQAATLQMATAEPSAPAPTIPSTPTTTAPITPTSEPAEAPAEGDAQLKMVLIQAKSALEVKQLRQMNLDIVRVRKIEPTESKVTPDSKEALLAGEFIIEAVVTPGELAKLKKLGFAITEVP